MPKTLTEWLERDCGAWGVRVCKVTIGNQSWDAAFYRQTFKYQEGMMAVSQGLKKVGEEYTIERFYCLGKLPSCYRPEGICFPFENYDWYVAAYADEKCLQAPFNRFHPFGISFILAPWDIPNETIDKHANKPYRRIPMTVI